MDCCYLLSVVSLFCFYIILVTLLSLPHDIVTVILLLQSHVSQFLLLSHASHIVVAVFAVDMLVFTILCRSSVHTAMVIVHFITVPYGPGSHRAVALVCHRLLSLIVGLLSFVVTNSMFIVLYCH